MGARGESGDGRCPEMAGDGGPEGEIPFTERPVAFGSDPRGAHEASSRRALKDAANERARLIPDGGAGWWYTSGDRLLGSLVGWSAVIHRPSPIADERADVLPA